MPVNPTPVSEDQLRQLLAERSEPARSRPVPQERIARRIRRARVKRAAGAGLLAVAVAAGVVSGVTLARDHAPGHAARYTGPPLPATFTASDGAVYRRLASTSLTEPAQKTAALTVRVGSDPVDLMGSCDRPTAHDYMLVKVNGTYAGLIWCRRAPQPIALPVGPGHTAVITFVPPSGPIFRDVRADWRLAAYAWTPPATIRPAPAAPKLPDSYTGPNTTAGHGTTLRRLIAIRSGNWPGDRTATFTLLYHAGHSFDVSTICAGPIGGRLQVSHQVDGFPAEAAPCTPAGPGQLDGGSVLGGVNGRPITLTFHIQAPSSYFAADYAKRSASWTIAVYEEQT